MTRQAPSAPPRRPGGVPGAHRAPGPRAGDPPFGSSMPPSAPAPPTFVAIHAAGAAADRILPAVERSEERAVNVLQRSYVAYRAWEDGYIAMLDALNDERPVDASWAHSASRRMIVAKMRT